MKKPAQTYNDGICHLFGMTNGAGRGRKPVPLLTPKYTGLRYARRTVGMQRFWTGMQQNVEIGRLIRLPCRMDVSTQDIAVLEDGQQYDIRQIQYPEDVLPPSMDLSLERRMDCYDIEGVPGSD